MTARICHNNQFGPNGYHVSMSGSGLVLGSDDFANPAVRSQSVKMLLGNSVGVQALCRLHYSQVQLKDKQKIVQTVPLECN